MGEEIDMYSFYKLLTHWSDEEIQQIKVWRSDFPKEFSKCAVKVGNKYQSLLGLDFYLEQFEKTSRDPPLGCIYVRDHDIETHKKYLNKLFGIGIEDSNVIEQYKGNDYVLILSSYSFDNNEENSFDTGIPDGLSDCSLSLVEGCQHSMPKAEAFNDESQGYDANNGQTNWKTGVYTRVHRSKDVISGMQSWLNNEKKQTR